MPGMSRFRKFVDYVLPFVLRFSVDYALNLFCNDASYEVQSQNISGALRLVPYIPVLLVCFVFLAKITFIDTFRESQDLRHDTGRLDNSHDPQTPQNSGVDPPGPARPPENTGVPVVIERLVVLNHKLDSLCDYLREQRLNDFYPERRSIESSSPADHLTLTIHSEEDVRYVAEVFQPQAITLGSQVLHREFRIRSESELEELRLRMIESIRRARTVDRDCTLQFGPLAVLKCTDDGPTWWNLEEHWTPVICNISRSSLWELRSGCSTKWKIKGFNLEKARLKTTSSHESEDLKILHHQKMDNGMDVLLCEEPLHFIQRSSPKFQKYIIATNFVEVEDGIYFHLKSELKNIKTEHWISGFDLITFTSKQVRPIIHLTIVLFLSCQLHRFGIMSLF